MRPLFRKQYRSFFNSSLFTVYIFPSAVNRTGVSIAQVSNLGAAKIKGVFAVLEKRIVENSILCSDGHAAYKQLADAIKLKEHIRIVKGRGKVKGFYSVARINAYHSCLKTWMMRFKGVATKYLNNYLVWNNNVAWSNVMDDEKERTMLNIVVSAGLRTMNKDVSGRNPIPVLI